MSDDGQPVSNIPEFSVSEISGAVKRTVEERFGHVRIRGEISRPSRPRSGHVYFTLKDDRAVIDAVAWRGVAAKLAVQPDEGLEVIVTGRLTTYPGASKYQVVVESIELAGEGALLKMLEERKRKLAAEGLFGEERKRALPYLPSVIGVITSPSGAVIRDILHRLADRFPRHVLLWPVAVQGEKAARDVAAAIAGFDALAPNGPVPRPDVLIVARGGGSLEDLMAFNEEVVVRAVAACRIPVISAVGHETDTTLIDFVADRRAPTPSAAAEMAVPVRAELLADLANFEQRQVRGFMRLIEGRRVRVEGLGRGLGDPRRLLESAAQRLDDRGGRLERAPRILIGHRRASLGEASARLTHPRRLLRERASVLGQWADRFAGAGGRLVARASERVRPLGARLGHVPLARRIAVRRESFGQLVGRFDRAVTARVDQARQRLAAGDKLLESYSYRGVLQRGYAVIRDGDDRPIVRSGALSAGQAVSLELADGRRAARIDDGAEPGVTDRAAPSKPAGRKTNKPPGGKQGQLF